MSPSDTESDVPEPTASDDAEAVLVEIEDGVAMLFGELSCSDLDLVEIARGDDKYDDLVDKLSLSAASVNLAIQGAKEALVGRGLVRFAPETLKYLKTSAPLKSGTWNLGVLSNGGNINHVVRWVPASACQGAQVLAALGPMGALLALSFQLSSLSRKQDEIIHVGEKIFQALRKEQEEELDALRESVKEAFEEARNNDNKVTDDIFDPVRHHRKDLQKQRKHFVNRVAEHLNAVGSQGGGDRKMRREYVKTNAREVIADVQGCLIAEEVWCGWNVLRAANIAGREQRASGDERLLQKISKETRQKHMKYMECIADLLCELKVQCRLLELLSEDVFSKMGKQIKSIFPRQEGGGAAEFDLVGKLEGAVAKMHWRLDSKVPASEPEISVFTDVCPSETLELIRLLLPRGSELLCLAETESGKSASYIGVTTDEFFISSRKSVHGNGVIDQEYLLRDIRYVRCGFRGDKVLLDIITKSKNICLEFGAWVREGEKVAALLRLRNHLAKSMNLPEGERSVESIENSCGRKELVADE